MNVGEKQTIIKISERDVVLSAPQADVNIAESDWLVMNARGFESESSARTFAQKLKSASELSSVIARIGIDAGVDLATSGFGSAVKEYAFEQSGTIFRDNIHGVDIFQDDPNVRIGNFGGVGTALITPDLFFASLGKYHEYVHKASDVTRDIILLLNYALMRPEPVAQIVFAFCGGDVGTNGGLER